MVKVLLSLGANVGDCAQTFDRAIEELRAVPGVTHIKTSSYIRTHPIGPVQDQPDFLNAVAQVETTLEPLPLLDHLKAIEAKLGRVHREKWGPREIDLDILTYGDATINHPRLQVPHPEIKNRPFLMELLSDIQTSSSPTVSGGGPTPC